MRCKKREHNFDFILAFSQRIWLHCVGSVLVGIVHRMSMTVIWMQMSLISALRLLFLDNNSSRLGAYWARLKLGRDNIAKNNSFTWPCQTNKQKNNSSLKSCSLRNFYCLIVKFRKKYQQDILFRNKNLASLIYWNVSNDCNKGFQHFQLEIMFGWAAGPHNKVMFDLQGICHAIVEIYAINHT